MTSPRLIHKVEPRYPEKARRANVSGSVIVQAIVRADGTVSDLELLRCTVTGFGFEEEALRVVEQWRYRPATKGGRPVSVHFTMFLEWKNR